MTPGNLAGEFERLGVRVTFDGTNFHLRLPGLMPPEEAAYVRDVLVPRAKEIKAELLAHYQRHGGPG